MSELNNKPVENLSENSLIDEFIKMGINIESAENKINYSNSNSNKKDLAFNYYFGSNPLNQNLQSNANFLNPSFSHMENFFMNNPIKSTGEGVSSGKDPNAVNYFNSKDLNNFNFTPEEFFNMHSNNSVENNKNVNNITQFNPNMPKQNVGYNDYNKNNLPQNNFANAARDDINYSNNNTNDNLNLNPNNNFFKGNKVNFDGIFINNPQIPDQKAFFNQMLNQENNLTNHPIGVNKNVYSGFFQNQNPMIKNLKQQNHYFNNPIINSNPNYKGSNKHNNNNNIRNENTNARIPYEHPQINSFPMMNRFNGVNNRNNNQIQYFMNNFANHENTNNFNILAKNPNIRFNTNHNNFIGGINNNNTNQPLYNFNHDTKGFKNRTNNQNQRNNSNNMGMVMQINMNEELQGAENLFYNSNNNFNQEEAILGR